MNKGKVIVRHKVRDLAAWKPFFVGDAKRQRDAGFTSWHLTRNKHGSSLSFSSAQTWTKPNLCSPTPVSQN